MSEENVEVVRRAFEAYNRGDIDAVVADFAPECEYIPTGAMPDAGRVYRGPEGYKRFFRWLGDEFEDARIEVQNLIGAGDKVLASVTLHGLGKQSGVETSWNIWQVWVLRNNKVVHGQAYTTRDEALEAAGLEE